MEVNQAIQKLLFLEDFVIIPGFGGFVSRYHPARIDAASGSFLPPVKEISFDAERVENDGKLVRYLSEVQNLTQLEARMLVDLYVEDLKRDLGRGKRVALGTYGHFTKNEGGATVFVPESGSNLYAGAYGLSPVHLTGLMRQVPVERPLPSVTDHPLPVALKPSMRQVSGNPRMLRRIAIAMPLLIVFSLLPYNSRVNDKLSGSTASMVPEPSLLRLNYPVPTDTASARTIEFPIGDSAAPATVADSIAEPTVSEPVVVADAAKYPVIAGCFRLRENAERLRQELSDKGYPSAILPSRNGLYKVAVKSYDTRREAINGLSALRKAEPGLQLWADVK